MNTLVRILRMPWLAAIRSAYGYLFVLVWFTFAFNVSNALPVHSGGARFGIAVLMLAVAVAWKMVADSLWLARDARALRVPGVGRDADSVPAVLALLSVLLPALVLGAVFGHFVPWLVSLALIAAGTLAFLLLPTAVAMLVLMLAVGFVLFGDYPPLPGHAGYLAWAIPATITLAAVAATRWIMLRRAVTFSEQGWWRPANSSGRLVQLRRMGGGGDYPVNLFTNGWRHPGPRTWKLRDVGPAHPIRSLRVALRLGLVPLDILHNPAHYWRWRAALAAAVLAPPIGALLVERHVGGAAILPALPQFPLFAAIMLLATSVADHGMDGVWNGPRADLSLPALLPNLTHPARAHRDALVACVTGNLALKLWFAYCFAMVFAVVHVPMVFYAYLLLTFAASVTLEFAAATGVLGGRRRPRLTRVAMYAVAMVPAVLTATWGVRVIRGARPQLEISAGPTLVCVLAWLACCVAFGLLALRNWRRFAAQPHPFLVHPSA